ncbi:hypothetical protein [Streptomyces endophyticus]|uniref:Uncharacterized protein n=1 Tax=Streptomyces endophyticus TaxID=714166 RepID=A0ABU6F0L6_9ACTN|nr:hypothetical protein [Streptomyces endophyticus]MEB8336990.1 hypothetical protein [Streptomyces endophyticus]
MNPADAAAWRNPVGHPLIRAARRRRLPILPVLANIPCAYATKNINPIYAWKALPVELLLVPLGLIRGLTVYEKGHGPGPAADDQEGAREGPGGRALTSP